MNTSQRRTVSALAAIGIVMVANSLLFGSRLFFDPSPFSESAGSTTHRTYYVVLLLCLAALSQVLPRLAGLTGASGRALPTVLATAAGLGAFFDGATRFMDAFVVPYLAGYAPELLDEQPESALMYAMISSWILFSVSLVALAVAAYRRHVFSRPACVLVVVGALSVPAVGPLSGIVVGSGLAWCALAARGRVDRDTAPAADQDGLTTAAGR